MLPRTRLGGAAATLARRLAGRDGRLSATADLARPGCWAPPPFSSAAADPDPDPTTSNVDTSAADDVRGGGRRLAFVDRVHCTAVGGQGGAGCAAFWRSKASGKYGPPDGGNGGRGGDVVIEAVDGLKSLRGIRPLQRAGPGRAGGPQKMHGSRGADCVVGVPPGTVVYAVDGRRGGDPAADAALDEDDDDGWWRGEEAGKTQQQQPLPSSGLRLVADLATPGARYVAAPGGAGGVGNAALPKSVERARRRAAAAASPSEAASAGGAALAGSPGAQASLRLELRSLADAGLVGPPNAGKSTLLRALSAARPRVGAYPFTTTRPHLGVLAERTQGDVGNPTAPPPSAPAIAAAATAGAAAAAGAAPPLTLADVPGLLPGAAAGVGLGHDFLRHVSRCAALVLVIDVSTTVAPPPSPDGPHPAVAALGGLLAELGAYEAGLPARPCVIAANKVDACPDGGAAAVAALKASAPPGCVTVVATSGRAGIGLEELAAAVRAAVAKGDE